MLRALGLDKHNGRASHNPSSREGDPGLAPNLATESSLQRLIPFDNIR